MSRTYFFEPDFDPPDFDPPDFDAPPDFEAPPDFDPDLEAPPDDFVEPREEDFAADFVAPDFDAPDLVAPDFDAPVLVAPVLAPVDDFDAPDFVPDFDAPPDRLLVFDAPPELDLAAVFVPGDLLAPRAPEPEDRELDAPLLAPEDRAPLDVPVLPLFAVPLVDLVFEEVSESPMTLPAASFTLLMAD